MKKFIPVSLFVASLSIAGFSQTVVAATSTVHPPLTTSQVLEKMKKSPSKAAILRAQCTSIKAMCKTWKNKMDTCLEGQSSNNKGLSGFAATINLVFPNAGVSNGVAYQVLKRSCD